MRHGVLLGGRSAHPRSSRVGWLTAVWLPVVCMLLVIWRESTDTFSSAHTGIFLRPLVESLFGQVSDANWEAAHHILRKTGHFVGYGTLGITWLRAWLLTWMMPLLRRPATVWWRTAWQMAICCTAIIAAADELHQTWIPSRTGLAQDVLLDTLGAMTFTSIIVLVAVTRQSVESRFA